MNKLLFVAVAAALVIGCQIENTPVDSNTTYMRDAFQPLIEKGEVPGFISILYNNGIQETCCAGYADAENKRPISLDDHYMQCSQTKGFCGVTIAKLVEEGRLNLDDPVSKYLPEFKKLSVRSTMKGDTYGVAPAKNVMTVRMCLNHTAGFNFELPNYELSGGWSRRAPIRTVAAVAAGIPLLFEPGTEEQYSNVGIDVGAAVVEVITGKRWEEYLKETVLDPLGMTDSSFVPTDSQLADRIELYALEKGKPYHHLDQISSMAKPYNDDRVFASAGAGLWTTARDQLKFYKMLMNLGLGDNGVRILKEETVKKYLAVSTLPLTKTASGKDFGGYSLGLMAPKPGEDNDDQWFGHGGAWCTECMVNWHRKQLRFWAVQYWGSGETGAIRNKVWDHFFKATTAANDGAYTGRMK